MEYKILINISVPSIEFNFNVYVPINKKIGTVKKYILNAIRELTDGFFNQGLEHSIFIDRDTGKEYDNNMYVKDSQLENGAKLIII